MAFQDFDLISERRRNEKRQKLRKRIIIGVVSIVALAGVIGAAFFVVTTKHGGGVVGVGGKETSNDAKKPETSENSKQVTQSQRVVKVMCGNADYKEKCERPLSEAMKKDPKLSNPKDLLKTYLKYAEGEVTKAIDKTKSMKFETKEEKGAYEDCLQLFDAALNDMTASINELSKAEFNQLSTKTPDLNSWLSAVISFQQQCIDGFPEGKLKKDLKSLHSDSKEFVSNSLAILSQMASTLSSLQALIGGRSHLSEKPSSIASLDKDGLPHWVNDQDRRMLKAADVKLTPNVTVAKDGSGQFKTINEAIAAMPPKYEGRYIIYVKEGIYDEQVIINTTMQNITIFGDGSQKSVITGNKSFKNGTRMILTATLTVQGDGFLGKAMGFRNTAGAEGAQAVAVRVQADRVIFVNSRFEGYQSTLFAQAHRQFYRSCIVSGTVDAIFGDAAAFFQNCILNARKPLDEQSNTFTAQARADKRQTSGIVLQKCDIKADDTFAAAKGTTKTYLGRPMQPFSRTVVMESDISDVIDPEGWMPMAGNLGLDTLYYAEYGNIGPGAKTDGRVKWPGYKVIDKKEATQFTVEVFLKGIWIKGSGVPSEQSFYPPQA